MGNFQNHTEITTLTNSNINNWWESQDYSLGNNNNHVLNFDKITKRHIELDDPSTVSCEKNQGLYPLVNKKDVLPYLLNIKTTYTAYDIYQQRVQKWKCVVTDIKDNIFRAKLEDLYEVASTSYELAEFDFEEISPSDLSLIHLGAVFYWSIGYEMKNGQLTKRSSIRFQRLVTWNEFEYEDALEKAEKLLNNIDWD